MLTAITGINWGDEGKGRMVDLLSREYDIVVRYQGGNNAGHTVVNENGKFILNLLPSGILRPEVVCVMGNGMVIDPAHLEKEMATLRQQGVVIDPSHLKISDRATICMPYHVREDALEEDRLSQSGSQFGSTRRGIAYSYGDKYMKKTLRMGDLLHLDDSVKHRLKTMIEWKNLTLERVYGEKPVDVEEMWAWCKHYAEVFRDYICDTGAYLAHADDSGKKILFEAQLGALRDVDFGIYPFTHCMRLTEIHWCTFHFQYFARRNGIGINRKVVVGMNGQYVVIYGRCRMPYPRQIEKTVAGQIDYRGLVGCGMIGYGQGVCIVQSIGYPYGQIAGKTFFTIIRMVLEHDLTVVIIHHIPHTCMKACRSAMQ